MRSIDVFVYGTLRPGGRFHDRFCRGLVRAEAALARGTVERLPAGYPRMIVSSEDVIARGSGDLAADAALLASAKHAPTWKAGDVPTVEGDVLRFDDAEPRLRALDRLEDFRPEGGGLYDRVVLVVRVADRFRPAFAYVAPLAARSDLRRLR
jgi:gamma-glutamylcyclotransferase (GGCT)/AIG2-like uncharacterized protein YtfP